jgi:hypothetical protein
LKAEKGTRSLAFQAFTYGPDPRVASLGEGMNPLARFLTTPPSLYKVRIDQGLEMLTADET